MKNLNFPASAELSRQVMRARADHHTDPSETVSEFYARVMARGCVALDDEKKSAETTTNKKAKK